MELTYLSIYGLAQAHLTCSDESVTTLHVLAQYHRDGQVETTEYTIERSDRNTFPLPEPTAEWGSGGYIVYRLDLAEGLFLLRTDLR